MAAPPAPMIAPADAVADRPESGDFTGWLAALAAVVGLGGTALIFLRRRRARPEADEVDIVPVSAPPAETVAPGYAFYDVPVVENRAESPAGIRAGTADMPAARSPAMAGPVPEGAEREDLLNAMVAAAPDADNPFTSRKARRRRARLILQARAQQNDAATPFDWRTYSPARTSVSYEDKPVPVSV